MMQPFQYLRKLRSSDKCISRFLLYDAWAFTLYKGSFQVRLGYVVILPIIAHDVSGVNYWEDLQPRNHGRFQQGALPLGDSDGAWTECLQGLTTYCYQ